MTRMNPGPGENHLVRSRSHGGRDHLSRLIQSLRGKPTGAMEAHRIAPASLLRFEPSPECFRKHGLARGAVQEDFGEAIYHALNLALYALHTAKNAAPRPVIGACYYVRVNNKEGVTASTVADTIPRCVRRKAQRG